MTHNSFHNIKLTVLWMVALPLLTASCKRLIEVPANPPSKIEESKIFADSSTTMSAVADVYSYPPGGDGGFTFNDANVTIYSGLSSDELSVTGTDINDIQFYAHTLTPDNLYMSAAWNNPYKGLYGVNAVLGAVPASPGLSETFKARITAEMKVVRALYYFYLVNRFGAVPLVLSTEYKKTSVLARSSVDSVYMQILADLNEARPVLSTTYPSAGHVRPNYYTALAFLARVHLYRKNWQQSFDAANEVITSNVYKLEKDLNKVFLDGSQEAIWQLPAEYPNTSFNVIEPTRFIPNSPTVMPTYPITPWLKNAFETGDKRSTNWTYTYTQTSGVYTIPYKYKNRLQNDPTVEDYMIFRMGEQYLIRAEAAVWLGKLDVAKADIDTIRFRAGLPPTTANPASAPDLLNAIMKERQTELFCEWGHRWLDLKRTGTADAILGAEKPGWKSHEMLYPVPNSQRLLNYRLSQNFGYN